MDDVLQQLVSELPESPTELTSKNIQKIQRYIPVPTDYKILWTDISSFGGYPSGIVITEQGLVVKATRDEVNDNKKLIQKANKDKEQRQKAPNTIYQIIPWEYYSPDDFDIQIEGNGKGKKYILKSGDTELIHFENQALYQLFTAYRQRIHEQAEAAEATFSALNTINVEGVMFNAAYGADQTKTGHGIYAEEAGSILDKLSGEHSTVVGRDNAKNGPDKIVNSSPIQCKYYKSAYRSVNACFSSNAQPGEKSFRYYDLSGNAMQVEVPADQYAQAIECMKTRITNGQVPGVTDPNQAYSIIRKGKITYSQAVNLAKAGTIESIAFDFATESVTCLSALGISAVVAFSQTLWITKDYKKAAKSALFTGLQVYGLSFAGGVIASQISRTGLMSAANPLVNGISRSLSPKTAQSMVNSFRALAGKKPIHGAAAQKSFAKFFGSTAVSQGVMFLVFSVPDTIRVAAGKMSGAQYFKNITSLAGSFAGCALSSALAGAAIGKKVGGKGAKAIGMLAGSAGGAIVGIGVKAVGDIFHEDDAVITARLFNAILLKQFMDNMLSPDEQDKVIALLDEDEKNLRKLQQQLLSSSEQEKDIVAYVSPLIAKVTSQRGKIDAKCEKELDKNIKNILLEEGLTYGM